MNYNRNRYRTNTGATDAIYAKDAMRRGMIQLEQLQKQLVEMTADRDSLMLLLAIFNDHYNCEACNQMCTPYIETCENPLHRLHDEYHERQAGND